MDNSIMVPGILVDSTNDTRTVSSTHWTAVVSHLLNWKTRNGQSWLAFLVQVSSRKVRNTTHSGVGV